MSLGFPGGSEGKASACNAGDPGSIPGWGISPGEGNGNPLQYSCLENPMDGEASWATVHGVRVAKNRTWPSDFTLGESTCMAFLVVALGITTHTHYLSKSVNMLGTFLVIQWLKRCAPKAEGLGSIPGQGIRPHVLQARAQNQKWIKIQYAKNLLCDEGKEEWRRYLQMIYLIKC